MAGEFLKILMKAGFAAAGLFWINMAECRLDRGAGIKLRKTIYRTSSMPFSTLRKVFFIRTSFSGSCMISTLSRFFSISRIA